MEKFFELNESQWLPESRIREIQNEKFMSLMRHCRDHVPYYSEKKIFHEIDSLKDISKLPFLTKEIIKDNSEALKAANYPEERFRPNSTSGSTGERLNFYSDARNIVSLPMLMLNNTWTGWNIGERQAMLWGSHYDISKAQEFSNKLKNKFIHKILYLSSYDMTELDMMIYYEKINNYKPALITGYPSGLSIFANFLKTNKLNIHEPKGIIASGETLYEFQREEIESVFKCKVLNRYGCREVGNIAHQCEKKEGLHINAEHIILEVLDEKGNPSQPGQIGEIVVTDLDNYVFPFVRYKIGDIGILKEDMCSCERALPLIEKVEGRIFDVITGTNGNYITGNFWTILLRTYVKGIKKFQVLQEHKDKLTLKLITDNTFISEDKTRLISKIYDKCGHDMRVNIEIVDHIPLTRSGKHKFVISNVSPFISNTSR